MPASSLPSKSKKPIPQRFVEKLKVAHQLTQSGVNAFITYAYEGCILMK